MPSLDSEQVDYARGVVAQLWPDPAVVQATTKRTLPPRRRTVGEWLLLPNPTRPTLLVPTQVPQASRMLQRHGNRIGPRAGRAALAFGVRSGALEHLPAARVRVTVDQGLGAAETRSAQVSLAKAVPGVHAIGLILGTPRPNRKPVIQLFADDGSTLGFVKVGLSELTRELVRTEAQNLGVVKAAGLRAIDIPDVLHRGAFDDLDLLVLSPMGSSQERRESSIPLPAMAELARMGGTTTERLAASTYLGALRTSAAQPGLSEAGSDLTRVAGRTADRWGDREVEFGSWHGDWAPWNMGYRDGRVQLWDWERFASGVPVGFDAVHFRAQRVRHGQKTTRRAEEELVREVPALLRQMGRWTAPPEPRLVLALYLLEISLRFLRMTSGETKAASVHPRALWAIDFAQRIVG